MSQRDIVEVIDRVVEVVPELAGPLKPTRDSAPFTPPEWMADRWRAATEILAERVPSTHPKHKDVVKIWNGG